MATNAPKSRKTHVTRIFGTNKKKEILSDMWADVERIDDSRSKDKLQGVRQTLRRKLKWRDDPKDTENYLDPDLEDELPPGDERKTRKTVLVKVCDPETTEDFKDPEEWIPIRKIKRVRSKASSQHNNVRQTQMERLVNDDIQHSRVVEARRIVHYDTNIDDDAQKAYDDDPTTKAYVVKGKDYTKKNGKDDFEGEEDTKDKDQWIEHEIVTKVIHKGNSVYYGNANDPSAGGTLSGRQVRKTKFLNQYLIEESEEAKLEKIGENDVDPPYRLDPFQNIVNINWGGDSVEFLDREL